MLAFLVLIIISLSASSINSKSLEVVKEYSNLIPTDGKESTCLTKGCVLSAAAILSKMDPSVDPCDNFYNFACGNFIKNTFIPEDKSIVISFNQISDILSEKMKNVLEKEILPDEITPFKMLKQYYQMCTNTEKIDKDGLTEIKNILQENGHWPVLQGSDWKEDDFHWTETMYKFRKIGLPFDAFLSVYSGMDTKNTSKNIINIDQASLGLEREYLIKGFDDVVVQAYYHYLVDLAVIFGADTNAVVDEITDIVKFEIELAQITLSREVRRNVSLLNNPMSIDELTSKYPFIPWYEYINSLIDIEDIELHSNEIVDLGVPTYLSRLEKLLEKTPKRVQSNYIMAQMVSNLVPYLPEELKNLELKFDRIVYGNQQREPLWKECLDLSLGKFKKSAGALYLRNYFDKNSKINAMALVENLKVAFRKMLNDLDWMDEATKEKAIEKANEMGSFVAYPEELLDDQVLSEYYSDLKIKEDDTFVMAYMKAVKFDTDKSFKELPKPVNKTSWIDHSEITTVNAFYDPEGNSIQLPGGILQGIFFGNDRPQYMNYGTMGFAIGHEITHGFDDVGRQFDKDGILYDWWEKETQNQFMEKTRCIIDQYSNYTVSSLNLNLDGVNTQGENIADNGGVKEAYLAYQNWVKENGHEQLLPGVNYTQNQLFWISCANLWCSVQREEYLQKQVLTDDHSPSEFRILGSFSNSEYFAQDFNCPKGSNMNPEVKCPVW